MTDTLPKPKPKRRCWRWLVLGLLLFIIGMVIWIGQSNRLLARRASQIVVGQSKDDVKAILGEPHLTAFRGQAGSYCYGSGALRVWVITALAYKYLRFGRPLPLSAFPIQVTFGDDGRVVSVRHPHHE